MTTWRDRITLVDEVPGFPSRPWTPTGRATAETVLDYLDPILGLSLLPSPVAIGWQNVAGTWNAQATATWVGIRDVAGTWQDRGFWEQSLTHELVHVVDKQMMNDADRATVMAALSSPPDPVLSGVHVTRNWLDGSQPYASNAGEAFAEGISRHWWFVERGVLTEADLDAWGMYTYDPPVFLSACRTAIGAALTRRRAVLIPTPAPVPPKPAPKPPVPEVPMTAAKWLPSPNYTRGREAPLTDIVLHWMAGTLAGTDSVFARSSSQVSAHYGIEDTVVHRYVRDTDTAWHAGDRAENHRSIGIEHSAAPGRPASALTIATSVALIVDLCRRYSISPDNIYPHKKFTATQCPGTLPIAAIIVAVRAQLGHPAPASPLPPVYVTPPQPAPKPKPAPTAPTGVLIVRTIDLRYANVTPVRAPGVAPLQRLLSVAVDGIAGPQTRSALYAAQRKHGVAADYIFGPNTASALLARP